MENWPGGVENNAEYFNPLQDADSPEECAYKKAWARLLSNVYEIDPFICPKYGSEMKVIAIIQKPQEIERILNHLMKQGRSPPGFDLGSLN